MLRSTLLALALLVAGFLPAAPAQDQLSGSEVRIRRDELLRRYSRTSDRGERDAILQELLKLRATSPAAFDGVASIPTGGVPVFPTGRRVANPLPTPFRPFRLSVPPTLPSPPASGLGNQANARNDAALRRLVGKDPEDPTPFDINDLESVVASADSLRKSDGAALLAAIDRLGRRGEESSVGLLLEVARDFDGGIERARAAEAVGRLARQGVRDAREGLQVLLDETDGNLIDDQTDFLISAVAAQGRLSDRLTQEIAANPNRVGRAVRAAATVGLAGAFLTAGDERAAREIVAAVSGRRDLDKHFQDQVAVGASASTLRNRLARERVFALAKDTGNQSLVRALRRNLPDSPISQSEIRRVESRFISALKSRIESAPEGSILFKFGRLLAAAHFARTDDDFRQHRDTLLAKLRDLHARPELIEALRKVRREAVSGITARARAQANFLLSDSFNKRLDLIRPQERERRVARELQKLAALDPELARRTAGALHAGHAVLENRTRILADLPAGQRESALARALNVAGDGIDKSAGTVSAFASAFSAIDHAAVAGDPGRLSRALISALGSMRTNPNAANAIRLVQNLEGRGALGGVATVASLVSMGAKGLPKNAAEGFALGSGLISLGNNAGAVAELLGVSSNTGTLATVNRTFKALGPVGAKVSVVLDIMNAAEELNNGDIVGGVSKLVSGAANSVAAAALTVMAFSETTGPAAPLVAAGAGLVALGAWAVDEIFGEDPEETLVRQALEGKFD